MRVKIPPEITFPVGFRHPHHFGPARRSLPAPPYFVMELILIAVGWYTIKNVKGASVMTAVAKARRMQAVKLADALNAIEGIPRKMAEAAHFPQP